MERLFWSLKHEWANHESFQDPADARLSVSRYIETFYNSERLHQTLDCPGNSGVNDPRRYSRILGHLLRIIAV